MALIAGSVTIGVMPYDHHAGDLLPVPAADCPSHLTVPVILDAIRHPVMRRWSYELLVSERGCWTVAQAAPGEMLAAAITRSEPDVVIVDTVDFPACCQATLDTLPPGHVIVIGPEPDAAYRSAAMAQGAAGWISREDVGGELGPAVRRALGCPSQVCPEETALPAQAGRAGKASPAQSARNGGSSR